MNALESSTLSRNVKNVVIEEAFNQGALWSIKSVVEELHEHLAITPEECASRLLESWFHGKSDISSFLLEQADQDDLKKVKELDVYKYDPRFRDAIDEAEIALSNPLHKPSKPERPPLKEPSLPRRHLLKLPAPTWLKRMKQDQKTSSLTTFLFNQKGKGNEE